MKPNPFYYSNFFSNTGIFEELFQKCDYPWQVMPMIGDFILNFEQTKYFEGFTKISDKVYVGKNVEIDDTARINGGAIISSNTTIGHTAFIRGNVLFGENVHVGHATEVKHSIILENSALAHLNYIGDSIVGGDNNISGGATLANWRFDKKIIEIKNGETRISTNMDKMGGILGDNCFIGINAVINPGTILAKNSLVYPLVSVRGTHFDPQIFK